MSVREAWFLFALFWAQFIVGATVPESWHAAERIGVGIVYLTLGLRLFVGDRARLPRLLRDGFKTSHAELTREEGHDVEDRRQPRSRRSGSP
jgi:hypothetical protein